MRIAKIISGIAGLVLSIYAYNNHTGFYFAPMMAWYCALITTLVTIEYWSDHLLKMIFGSITLCTYNNLLDETLFNPFYFGVNEKIFAAIISINFIINLFKWIKHQNNTTTNP